MKLWERWKGCVQKPPGSGRGIGQGLPGSTLAAENVVSLENKRRKGCGKCDSQRKKR
jgi:hypothetical protein